MSIEMNFDNAGKSINVPCYFVLWMQNCQLWKMDSETVEVGLMSTLPGIQIQTIIINDAINGINDKDPQYWKELSGTYQQSLQT